MRSLSSLQKDILTLIASSSKSLVTNQIATMLGKDQTTIYNSVESLIERGMLEPERQKNGIRKYLKLTERGLFDVLPDILSHDTHDKQTLINNMRLISANNLALSPVIFGIVNLKINGTYYLIMDFVEDDYFHFLSYDDRLKEVKSLNEVLREKGKFDHDIGVIDFMFLQFLIRSSDSMFFKQLITGLKASEEGDRLFQILSKYINIVVAEEIERFKDILERGLLLFPYEQFEANLKKILEYLQGWIKEPPVYRDPDQSKDSFDEWIGEKVEEIDEEEEGANP